MSRQVHYAHWFDVDVHYSVAWYVERGGIEVAERLVTGLGATVSKLSSHPELGRRPFPRDADLTHLHSFLVEAPFNRLVIFYRYNGVSLTLERLIHGARDLPRRLRESPLERK